MPTTFETVLSVYLLETKTKLYMMWCDVIRYDALWYMIWYDMIYDMIWYDTIQYDIWYYILCYIIRKPPHNGTVLKWRHSGCVTKDIASYPTWFECSKARLCDTENLAHADYFETVEHKSKFCIVTTHTHTHTHTHTYIYIYIYIHSYVCVCVCVCVTVIIGSEGGREGVCPLTTLPLI